jgi:hypothetical protein
MDDNRPEEPKGVPGGPLIRGALSAFGGLIRQHRETDYAGNFIKKPARRVPGQTASSTAKSSFDDQDTYELTELGDQFVHYA